MIRKKRRAIHKVLNKFKNKEILYVKKKPEIVEELKPEQPEEKEESIPINTILQQIKGSNEPQIELAEYGESGRIPIPQQLQENIEIKKDILSEIRSTNERYTLIKTKNKFGDMPLGFAHIIYDKKYNKLKYYAIEPLIDKKLEKIIQKTINELHDRLEIDFSKIKNIQEANVYINKEIDEIWNMLGFKPKGFEGLKIKYYIFREAIGLGKIDLLTKDPNIEDISCDGVDLPIYIYHRNPIYGEIETNLKFHTKEELDSFAMRLAQKCNRTISVAAPLMDGALPDGSRVQITYGTDIARRGSNFTIRKFFRTPLTPINLLNTNTTTPIILAYLWLAIEREKSILISGTTATGKTTLLNVLSLFIEPNLKIVSIEDTAELQIPHMNWMPQVTRTGLGSNKYGEVTMYDLLTSSLRQRPDYLIVGEVRGKEANVLFQAMSTGHPGLSTIHADTVNAVIDRLTTRPIELPISLLQNLDMIIFLDKTRRGDKLIRRISKIIEIEGYDFDKKQLKTNTVFEWVPADDSFKIKDSYILKRIAERTGLSDDEIHKELSRRVNILKWMQKNQITKFEDVAKLIHTYYINPQELAQYMK